MDKNLLDDIKANHAPRKMRPADYGITIKEYAKAQSISDDAATKGLNGLVDAGFLICETDWIWHGKAAQIYVRADKGKPKGK